MGDLLRDAAELSPGSLVGLLSESMAGLGCSLVDRSYPDELVLGFGESDDEEPLSSAAWMLYTRDTPWDLETASGVVASSEEPSFSARTFNLLRRGLRGRPLERIESRLAPVAVTWVFADAALYLRPTVTGSRRSAWELRTPDEVVVRACLDGSFDVVPADSELEATDEDLDNFVPAAAAAAARTSEGFVTKTAARHLLLAAARELGWYEFEPRRKSVRPDYVLLLPSGRTVLVEIKQAQKQAGVWLELRTVEETSTAESVAVLKPRRVEVVSQPQVMEELQRFASAA